MPVVPHRRMTFSGVFGEATAPFERWSFRINFAPGEAGDDLQAMADAGRAAWESHIKGRVYNIAKLTEVKTASIGPDGKYTADPKFSSGVSNGGIVSSNWYPVQVSQAVSFGSARRGPRGKGRIFLPAPVGTLDPSTGAIGANDATATSSALASALGAMNAAAGFGNAIIVSYDGTSSPITSVRVGRVLDTIRSRRSSLLEAYATPVVVP